MKALLLSISLVSLFALAEQDVRACSCGAPIPSKLEAMTAAELSQNLLAFNGEVFKGRVVKIRPAVSEFGNSKKVSFEVSRYWQGTGKRRVDIHTFFSEASCGAPYRSGRNYFVISSNVRGELWSTLCEYLGASRNQSMLLKRLGRGRKPNRQ